MRVNLVRSLRSKTDKPEIPVRVAFVEPTLCGEAPLATYFTSFCINNPIAETIHISIKKSVAAAG